MAIILKEPPQKSVDELKNAMTWFHDHKSSAVSATSLLQTSAGNQNTPHPIYNLDRDQILAKKGLAAAKLVGWRYIIKDDAGDYHVAEVGVNETATEHSFRSFNEGAHLNSFVSLFNNFSLNEAVKGSDYELCVLRIPACYIMAIWLKEKGNHDLFLPLDPLQPGFTAGTTYNAADFMKIVEDIAETMAKQTDKDAK
jgi:hypothetical protein